MADKHIEIADDWNTICANVNNGTYSSKYQVGNYKPIDLGDKGIINMKVIEIDGPRGKLVFQSEEYLDTIESDPWCLQPVNKKIFEEGRS